VEKSNDHYPMVRIAPSSIQLNSFLLTIYYTCQLKIIHLLQKPTGTPRFRYFAFYEPIDGCCERKGQLEELIDRSRRSCERRERFFIWNSVEVAGKDYWYQHIICGWFLGYNNIFWILVEKNCLAEKD